MLVLVAFTSPLVLIDSERIPFSTETTKLDMSFDLFFLKELLKKTKIVAKTINAIPLFIFKFFFIKLSIFFSKQAIKDI